MSERDANACLGERPDHVQHAIKFGRERDDRNARLTALNFAQDRLGVFAGRSIEIVCWLRTLVVGIDEVALEMGADHVSAMTSRLLLEPPDTLERSLEHGDGARYGCGTERRHPVFRERDGNLR